MNKTLLAVAISASIAPAYAAETQPENVLVTATRTPQSIDQTLAPVSVITRADIEKLQPVDVTDLLKRIPGIDINQSGGYGSATSAYLRGTNSDHTLFLINGQRISSATLGGTQFQLLDPSQIERIEVVRGSRSSLYGSDAIGGVVQIFTRQATDGIQNYVTGGVGSHQGYRFGVGSSGQVGNFDYSAHLSYLQTEGIDNMIDDRGNNYDDDAYRNNSANIHLGYRFDNGVKLSLDFLQSNTETETDSSFTPSDKPYANDWTQSIDAKVIAPITKNWLTTLAVGQSVQDSDNLDEVDLQEHYHFRTTRESVLWQNDLTLAQGHILTLGYDFYDDQVKSSSEYVSSAGAPVKSRDNKAVFAQYQGNLGPVDVVLGLREDDNEELGTQTTGNASFGVPLGQSHKLILSYNEGFKAPTFNDLYWPITPWSWGNPDLLPEESTNVEVAFRGDYQNFNWELSLYQNEIDNLIDWAPVDPSNPWSAYTPSNVANVEIEGVEFTFATTLAEWHIQGSYSHVDPRDEDNDLILNQRTRNTLKLDASRQFDQLNVGLGWRVQDERYTNADNTDKVGGFGLVDLRLGYQVTPELSVRLKVDNLFDKNYRTNNRYHQDGTSYFVSFNYTL